MFSPILPARSATALPGRYGSGKKPDEFILITHSSFITYNSFILLFKKLVFSSILISVTCACYSQGNKKWDVNNTPAPFKEVSFTVNEGNWMNLDVSPDCKEIVFDLLGDIYLLPLAGGDAKVLRQGLALE